MQEGDGIKLAEVNGVGVRGRGGEGIQVNGGRNVCLLSSYTCLDFYTKKDTRIMSRLVNKESNSPAFYCRDVFGKSSRPWRHTDKHLQLEAEQKDKGRGESFKMLDGKSLSFYEGTEKKQGRVKDTSR